MYPQHLIIARDRRESLSDYLAAICTVFVITLLYWLLTSGIKQNFVHDILLKWLKILIQSEVDPRILRTCLRSIVQRISPFSKTLKRGAGVWLNLDCPVVQGESLAPSKLLLWDVEVVWHLWYVISIDTEALVSFFAALSNDPSSSSSWDLWAYHWYGHFFEIFKPAWWYLGISQMDSSMT